MSLLGSELSQRVSMSQRVLLDISGQHRGIWRRWRKSWRCAPGRCQVSRNSVCRTARTFFGRDNEDKFRRRSFWRQKFRQRTVKNSQVTICLNVILKPSSRLCWKQKSWLAWRRLLESEYLRAQKLDTQLYYERISSGKYSWRRIPYWF